MDLVRIYYYTSVPMLTCSALFYTISTMSSSITNSQNVVRFIYEHKDCDSLIFKKEMENSDLLNKLDIIENLIYDVIKHYCKTENEFEQVKDCLKNPELTIVDEKGEYALIELTTMKSNVFSNINIPIQKSIKTTIEIIHKINNEIEKIQEKMLKHNKYYLKKLVTLKLQEELTNLRNYSNLLDKRLNLLLELLKIYLPMTKI